MAAASMAADFDYGAVVSNDNIATAVAQLMMEVKSIKNAVESTAVSLPEANQKLSSAIATISNGANDLDKRFEGLSGHVEVITIGREASNDRASVIVIRNESRAPRKIQ